MTNRQKAHFTALCVLCQQKKRPVTATELAEAEGTTWKGAGSAGRALNVLIYQGLVVWCRKGKKKYYWPRGWRPPRGGAGG